jgi:hypothetical protein
MGTAGIDTPTGLIACPRVTIAIVTPSRENRFVLFFYKGFPIFCSIYVLKLVKESIPILGSVRRFEMSWHPVDFLEFWTDTKVDQQPLDLKKAEYLTKRFKADAAAQGFTLADFNFDNTSLMKYMLQSMASPRA